MSTSISAINTSASSCEAPQTSIDGKNCRHTGGYSAVPQMRQRRSVGLRFTQTVLAGLPSGIPGIGEEIEAAIQQAPHSDLQSTDDSPLLLFDADYPAKGIFQHSVLNTGEGIE